jgi:hypothetical protein
MFQIIDHVDARLERIGGFWKERRVVRLPCCAYLPPGSCMASRGPSVSITREPPFAEGLA